MFNSAVKALLREGGVLANKASTQLQPSTTLYSSPHSSCDLLEGSLLAKRNELSFPIQFAQCLIYTTNIIALY